MKYKVELQKNTEFENFELHKNNIGTVHIQDKMGKDITNEANILLTLSREALLGFGKSLIRYAYEKEIMGGPLHFYRTTDTDELPETLGLILIPQSVEPILGEKLEKSIDQIIKEQDNKYEKL
jgi:hypothetical protein